MTDRPPARPWTRTGVAVEGGTLTVGVIDPSDPSGLGTRGGTPVLAVHGITANHRCFVRLAEQLPERRLLAPDLRGRGRSDELPGPYGLVQHADDLVRVLDDQGLDRAVVAGHSMGAFVAVRLAARHRDRVEALVLVDGGLPLPTASPDALGPALDRLSMAFASEDAYLDFWRVHPAFRADWTPAVEDDLRYDLAPGEGPGRRPSAQRQAVLTDLGELDGRDGYAEALVALGVPITFLRAERGMLDQPEGLYDPDQVRSWLARVTDATHVEVRDVNHYTILISDRGAAAVAEAVRTAASHPDPGGAV